MPHDSGLVEGKVAFITGAARGMGRAHALRLAEEGADIIGLDICAQIDSVLYPLATPDDLAETVQLVEKLGRTMVAVEADVRDVDQVQGAVDEGLARLGHIDIVCANAGITFPDADAWTWKIGSERWHDVIDTNLTGVWHTVRAAVPPMIERGKGGSIVITSSTGGLKGMPTLADYTSTKHAVVGLMRTLAKEVAEHNIRVNTVHPTGVRTPMIENEAVSDYLQSIGEAAAAGQLQNLLPVELVEPVDVSNAVLWLSSDQARYVTGVSLPVDAGLTQR